MLRRLLRDLILSFTLFLLLASPAFAQKTLSLNTDKSQQSILIWMGCEGANCAGLTIDATAGGKVLTAAQINPVVTDVPSGFTQAQVAVCYNTGAKIWISAAPSATITLATARGLAVTDGSSFSIYGYTNISNFHAIRDAAVSSTLYCDYYRQP